MKLFIGICKLWKSGNSTGVTIPSRICKAVGLSKGSLVKMYYCEKENKIEIFLNN